MFCSRSCLPVIETGIKRIEQASENHDNVAQRTSAGETVLKRPADYVPMLGDWNYPQWNIIDSYVYTSNYRMWLVNVAESEPASNAPRLEDRELFLEGKLHLDPISETGVEPQTIEHPSTSYDYSDEIGAPHVHETAQGYLSFLSLEPLRTPIPQSPRSHNNSSFGTASAVDTTEDSSAVSEDEVIDFKPRWPLKSRCKTSIAQKREGIVVDTNHEIPSSPRSNDNCQVLPGQYTARFASQQPRARHQHKPDQHLKKFGSRELLLRVQEEETMRQGMRYRKKSSTNMTNPHVLGLVQHGAGTDPKSPIAQALLRLGDPQQMMLFQGPAGGEKNASNTVSLPRKQKKRV